MFILYGLLVGIAVGLLLHGRLSGLADLRLRWVGLILVGIAIQLVLFSEVGAAIDGDLGPPLYVASTGLVLVAVLRNTRVAGMAVVALGATCNLAAIVANGGYMPTTPQALAALGAVEATGYSNSAVVTDARLAPLTDIFAMPPWMPFANVFSIGDVLIGAGVAFVVIAAMRKRPVGQQGMPSPA